MKEKIGSKWSLCTYKDPDLPLDARLDDALRLLRGIVSLEATQNQEILGQAGAIHKRRWEAFARKQDLEQSLVFYLRGFPVNQDFFLDGVRDLGEYNRDVFATESSLNFSFDYFEVGLADGGRLWLLTRNGGEDVRELAAVTGSLVHRLVHKIMIAIVRLVKHANNIQQS